MKFARITLTIAFLIVSVCLSAKQEMDPATLVFANNDVHSVNVRGNAEAGLPSNEIFISRRIYDGQGNLFITGGFTGTVRFGDTVFVSNGLNDYYLAKFTTAGSLVWITTQGGPNSEIGYDLTIDHNGNVYTVGTFELSCTFYGQDFTSFGGYDAITHKYDRNGKHLWTKDIAGSTGDDAAYSITIDSLGYVYILGSFSGTAHMLGNVTLTSIGGQDLFLLKMQPTGTCVWISRYGTNDNEHACRVAIGTRAGRPRCVTIIWSETVGGKHLYVWYDENGNLLSTKSKSTAQ